MRTRRELLAASAAGFISTVTGTVQRVPAQTISKPVRIIVGFPAGGGTDIIARILAERLRGSYAATVLIENKPGASARLAVEYVKNAEPDGSVILFTPDFPLTIYPHSFKSLSYDPVRDFTAIAPVSKSMLTYNIGPAVPEAGYNIVRDSWLGVLGPAKMPAEIVNALSAAIAEAVKVPQMIDSLAKVGNEPKFESPADLAATLKADIAWWGPVVKASGFVAED